MRKRNLITFCILTLSLFFIVEKNVYAEDYVLSNAPEKFTTNKVGRLDDSGKYVYENNDAVMANDTIGKNGNNIIDYHAIINGNQQKIFCIERMTPYPVDGATYTIDYNSSVNYGIVYIITHASDYYKQVTNDKLEASWLTQAAIWRYQNDNNFASITGITAAIFEDGATGLDDIHYYSNNAVILWRKAGELANAAKSEAGNDPSNFNALQLTNDGTHTVDETSKKIKTSLISIQDSGNFTTFSLDIAKVPEGTKVYDETGSELKLTNLNNLPSSTKFYLEFPIGNPKNYSFNFGITAIAKYPYNKGYRYTSGGNQPVVLVAPTSKEISTTLTIEGSHVEDSASSVSKVMYITGLFILLCGVGIIYANVKPKKQQI